MANNCFYTMRAVSKNADVLNRLVEIMNYRDSEYYIYRCFSADIDDEWQEGEFHVLQISGDVAWSCCSWFEDTEKADDKIENGSHYITLDKLCERLGMAVEVFSEEGGMCFQEWHHCRHDGNVSKDCVEWHQEWLKDGEWLDEPEESGGLDYYECFNDAKVIWGD